MEESTVTFPQKRLVGLTIIGWTIIIANAARILIFILDIGIDCFAVNLIYAFSVFPLFTIFRQAATPSGHYYQFLIISLWTISVIIGGVGILWRKNFARIIVIVLSVVCLLISLCVGGVDFISKLFFSSVYIVYIIYLFHPGVKKHFK